MKRISGPIAFLAIAVACGGEPGELPARREPADVVVSKSAASYSMTAVPATVVATERAELATRISGTIRRVAVDIGARVSAGDTLVSLDTSEIDARIASAEAAAQLARRWHERIRALAEDGAATPQELDDAQARLAMARAALSDARAQRDYVVLRAPFSGVVTARRADPGDLAVPGVPVLVLLGAGAVKIEADLPAELAGRLAANQRVSVFRPETGERHEARITRVVPAVEPTSRRFRVEARFAPGPAGPPKVPPGSFVRLELEEPGTTTRWIPADALVRRGQLVGVYVANGASLRLRWVRLGQRLGESVELLAGPSADLLLVRDPSPLFVDGQPLGTVRQVEWSPPFAESPATRVEGVR